MTYVYLGNNLVGLKALQWLVAQRHPPSGLVVHPVERGKYRDEIVASAGLPDGDVLEAPDLRTRRGLEWLAARQPDWLISVYFGYVLRRDILAAPKNGAVNLHPALLPYNRGAHPNVWSIVDGTPAGVTLHFIDEGIDTGDIIAQREVPSQVTDTGASLYARLEEAALALFMETWPAIYANALRGRPQSSGGTFHPVAGLERIDRIKPDQVMAAGDLINILRARTFPPYKGAYLDLGDRRVYLRLELVEERA